MTNSILIITLQGNKINDNKISWRLMFYNGNSLGLADPQRNNTVYKTTRESLSSDELISFKKRESTIGWELTTVLRNSGFWKGPIVPIALGPSSDTPSALRPAVV